MKFWLLTSTLMLTAVGYASVVAPCQKTVPVDLSGHIAKAIPLAEVAERNFASDYALFAGSEATAESAKDGEAARPSEPAAVTTPAVQAPAVSTGSGKNQSGKDAGDQAPADPTKNYLIYFTATWCGPCQSQKPIIEEIKAAGKHKVHIVDIDNDRQAAASWGVSTVPTVATVVDGKVTYRGVGAGHSRAFLESKLESK